MVRRRPEHDTLTTLPVFHSFGIGLLFRMLVSGRKLSVISAERPVTAANALSANVNVHTAVVFGSGYDSLGMLVFPSDSAAGLSREELLESIEPSLELGNAKVPAYARVSPDSVIIKDVGFEVPMTAKSTWIRSRLLELCGRDIEWFYAERELGNEVQAPVTDGDVGEIVRETMKLTLLIEDSKLADDSDFFSLGMDSLQASHARSRLLRRVDLGGHSLAANVAFDFPTVDRLTQHIVDVRNGRQSLHSFETMKLFAESLVRKYTRFSKIEPGAVAIPPGEIVLLTGATGTIGCHILHSLARQPHIEKLYCLVRAEQDTAAKARIIQAIAAARLDGLDESQMSKIVPLAIALGQHRLGLDDELYEVLRTVASVLRGRESPLREVLYDWEAASDMGYGQSKWVAGDTRYGMWNPTETIPIMVQSAITTGTLPITEGPLDTHFWLPVDLAAASIVELALQKSEGKSEGSASVFHVSNATPVQWSSEFLPALRRHGMLFEAVPATDWLCLLEKLNLPVEDNPAYRLLEWFKRKYQPKVDSEAQDNNLEMDLTNSRRCSSILRSGVRISDELIGKFLRYWTQLESWKALKLNSSQ
ncbi:hypothetical protein F4820DRAFT_462977 [Hypoxylon rubiginosum]|uniref:Uncharacterized protein n=1 Tax=Hypoxylon rubiginosum TaxID=110542 RepID=A0ACB9YIW4_9PEZI|nr:hypothetical protein F4820DRAFT_462977 [Hypoxylon rubiginosum]